MHKGHLAPCAIVILLALGFFVATGGSAGGLGVLFAALLCPIAMVLAMRVLMGGRNTGSHDHSPEAAATKSLESERA